MNTEGTGGPTGEVLVMRFLPQTYNGKMMTHCHRLNHEDQGMMGLEWVHDGGCVCDSVWSDFIDNVVIFGNEWESWNVTDEATTEEVTTEEATTEEATTEEATTEEATTEEPTTQEPTTEEQTTENVSTEEDSTTQEQTTAEACETCFVNPVEISANEDKVLKLDMTIEYATIDVNGRTIQTRLLNGLFPGPTLRISAGGYMEVNYFNNLQQQETSVTAHNFFQTPDKSNLHFHGPFISGSLPSDDVTMGVEPQNGYDYKTTFPEEHLPGTHWIHPHYHGSTTLQVAGGASATLIQRYKK